MLVLDLAGAVLTLISLGFLALGGYLLAVVLLGEAARRDRLALAVASLLAATAQAVAVGLLLGAVGLLRLELALALQALLVLALLRRARALPVPWGEPGRGLAWRLWERVRSHPILSLLALHAAASEALRGLLRPPLSWDSLMYHLLLAGRWLQEGDLQPVFGPDPTNFYGFFPANGSLWFWWWLAPSHSELYVNLASFPHWALFALAAGAVARQLGAREHWPYASFLVALVPTVIRFAATQYVDLLLAGSILGACFFGLRWLRSPGWADALLVGLGLGLAAGTKHLGVPYALALAAALVLAARGGWRRRLPQVAVAALLLALLGSYFYVRNVALGASPFAGECLATAEGEEGGVPGLPRPNSVVSLLGPLLRHGTLVDSFLGITHPGSLELGVGPPALLFLLAALVFPLAVPREHRREGLVAGSQVAVEVALWATVADAQWAYIFGNVRYLVAALGLAAAGGMACLERWRMRPRWLDLLVVALVIQEILLLRNPMPRQVRILLALVDVTALALALSAALRGRVRRHRRPLAVGGTVLALLLAPLLGHYRSQDRGRAFRQELTAHRSASRFLAGAWEWLDRHGGGGTVAVTSAPGTHFLYPAMGQYLERRAVYVNIHGRGGRNAVEYPRCDPRTRGSPEAWVRNLRRMGVRWVHVGRFPPVEFPVENRWAEERPGLFTLRYQDATNRVYELPPPGAQPRR